MEYKYIIYSTSNYLKNHMIQLGTKYSIQRKISCAVPYTNCTKMSHKTCSVVFKTKTFNFKLTTYEMPL